MKVEKGLGGLACHILAEDALIYIRSRHTLRFYDNTPPIRALYHRTAFIIYYDIAYINTL